MSLLLSHRKVHPLLEAGEFQKEIIAVLEMMYYIKIASPNWFLLQKKIDRNKNTEPDDLREKKGDFFFSLQKLFTRHITPLGQHKICINWRERIWGKQHDIISAILLYLLHHHYPLQTPLGTAYKSHPRDKSLEKWLLLSKFWYQQWFLSSHLQLRLDLAGKNTFSVIHNSLQRKQLSSI